MALANPITVNSYRTYFSSTERRVQAELPQNLRSLYYPGNHLIEIAHNTDKVFNRKCKVQNIHMSLAKKL